MPMLLLRLSMISFGMVGSSNSHAHVCAGVSTAVSNFLPMKHISHNVPTLPYFVLGGPSLIIFSNSGKLI